MLNISEFGLVEITRKRSRANLERLLTQPCPYCCGRGRIKSIATICLNLRKELLHLRGRTAAARSCCCASTRRSPAPCSRRSGRSSTSWSARSGVHILLQSDPELHHERFDVVEV